MELVWELMRGRVIGERLVILFMRDGELVRKHGGGKQKPVD